MPVRKEETVQDLIFYIDGEVDHHNSLALREEIDREIAETRAERVVLDLSQTTFCDSSALGLILGRVRVANEEGLTLCVRNASARAEKILRLCGAGDYLTFLKTS